MTTSTTGRTGRLSFLLATTVLGGALAQAAQAADIVQTPADFSANAGANGCGVVAGISGPGRFGIEGTIDDGANIDQIRRVLTDANGAVIAENFIEQIPVGSVAFRSNGLTATAQNHPLPLRIGYRDIGANSSGALIGMTDVPVSVMRSAGGICEQIADGTVGVNTAPMAEAGADQAVGIPRSGAPTPDVTLDGSASTSAPGETLRYSWTRVSGPNVTISAAQPFGPVVTVSDPDGPGTLVMQLTVSDSQGRSDTDTLSIVYSEVNTDPVADAGADQTGVAGDGVFAFLDASGSSDPDGDAITYEWRQVGGPTVPVTVTSPDGRRIRVGDPAVSQVPTSVTFRLTVRDGNGGVATDDVVITYSEPNGLPVAVAGPDQAATLAAAGATPGEIVLDGSGSSDPDGDPITFTWTQSSGPAVTIRSDNADGSRVVVTEPSTPGTVVIELRVEDDQGGASTDSVSIVYSAPNTAPVADAGPDQTNQAGDGVFTFLDGSGSSDPDGDTLSYEWRQVSGPTVPVTVVSSDGSRIRVGDVSEADVPATVVFRLTVRDGNGGTATDEVSITYPENQPPTADAGPDQTTSLPAAGQTATPVVLSAVATDPERRPVSYSWVQLSGPAVTITDVTPNSRQVSLSTPETAGTVVIELTVTDDANNTATDTVSVTYDPAPNTAPSVDASDDQMLIGVFSGSGTPQSATVSATASDPDGDPLAFTWTQLSGPATTLVTSADAAGTSTRTYSQPASAGTVVYEVSVSDGRGGVETDTVSVVWQDNTAPTSTAPATQPAEGVVPGTSVPIDLGTITDPDGQPVTVSVVQVSGPAVTISGGTTRTPSFTAPDVSGTVVVEVTLSDGVSTTVRTITIPVTVNSAPTAEAGADRTLRDVAPGTEVVLDGTGSSDPDGDTLSYAWRQVSGPSVTLVGADTAQPRFTYPAQARPRLGVVEAAKGAKAPVDPKGQPADTLVFELVVSDGTLTSSPDTVSIVINTNLAPTAEAGEVQEVFGLGSGDTVQLDGTGSSDPDGDALTYLWSVTTGSATLSDATAARPTLTYTGDGDDGEDERVELSLVVNDGSADSAPDTVAVVFRDNRAPTANAGADIGPFDAGQTVTLNGGASTDPDDDALTYRWTQVSGPSVNLSGPNSASPTFVAPDVDGDTALVFSLEVSDGRASSTDTVSVSVRPVGTIRIVQTVTGADGTFVFASSLAALSGSITTNSGTGALSAERVATGRYTVTAADARAAGYALTGLSCSDDDSTSDLASRTATIELAPGEDVVCTFESVNSREAASDAIRTALTARSQMLLASEPDMGRRLDRLRGTTGGGRGASVAGLTIPGSGALGLSANISERNVEMSGSLASANASGGTGGALDRLTRDGTIDVWGEARFADLDFQGRNGDFSVIYLGADYRVSDRLLVGGLVQFDDFSLGEDGAAGTVDGDGFMAGPYLTARLGSRLYFDARAAWGTSDNAVNPLGTFSDDFDTSRALYAGTLTGDFKLGEHTLLSPAVSVRHLSERQKAYTDSLGVDILEQDIDLGELSFGPRVSRTIPLGRRWMVKPWGEARGVLNFGNAADQILASDTRLRLEGGADWQSLSGVRFGLSGFADGIGSDDLDSYGARISLSYTMK